MAVKRKKQATKPSATKRKTKEPLRVSAEPSSNGDAPHAKNGEAEEADDAAKVRASHGRVGRTLGSVSGRERSKAATGHAVNVEEPDLFNSLTDAFLTLVDSGRWRPRDPRSYNPSTMARK